MKHCTIKSVVETKYVNHNSTSEIEFEDYRLNDYEVILHAISKKISDFSHTLGLSYKQFWKRSVLDS